MGMEKSILEKLHKNMLEIYQEISKYVTGIISHILS